MSSPAITADGISKVYRLGRSEAYDTLREAFVRRLRHPLQREGFPEITALDDVSFEIAPGTATGIIGANGAGKSTLLKVLSRITRPSSGRAVVRGRVGSLLEVGTGFHPELTGRENAYLSGAILGMSKTEIDSKLDDIVEFAGVARFLDTAIKHYSSGMYVRLGFSVAAHLEPEILLVDEVLSVGDIAFQKKCLGKMDDVAASGRTVLFVSHNLPAVTRLCDDAIWLENGTIRSEGKSEDVAAEYSASARADEKARVTLPADPSRAMRLRSISVRKPGAEPTTILESADPLEIEIEYDVNERVAGAHTIIFIHTIDGVNVIGTGDADTTPERLEIREPGRYTGRVRIPPLLLGEGVYSLTVSLSVPAMTVYDRHADVLTFEVVDHLSQRRQWQHQRRPGVLGLEIPWDVIKEKDSSIEHPH